MELRHLRYFLAVAQELNFTRAAESLFISQPPLSRQIKELEKELDVVLFDRSNRSVKLTKAGSYFQKAISANLRDLETIISETKKISVNLTGAYKIAYISSTYSKTLASLLTHLSECFPYLTSQLFEIPTIKQVQALETKKLDLAIVRSPLMSENIKSELWYTDTYSLVFNPDFFPIGSPEEVSEIDDLVFVFFNKQYALHYYETLISICSYYGFSPNVVHESNNINSILQLVREGLGVSIVPTRLKAIHSRELCFLDLEEHFTSQIFIAWHRESRSPVTKAAVAFLKA